MDSITPCAELANDDVTVILIPYENRKARKIFTKVNRYAKPTTTGPNLVTDDDDIIAVLSRHVANKLIHARLVKYTSNTLGNNDLYFTTLAAVADCNDAILRSNFSEAIDRTSPVDNEREILYREKIIEVWKHLLENISLFSLMLEDDEQGDEKRRELRRDYLLGKPIPQECLFQAFCRLTNLENGKGKLTYEEAANKLNSIDWSIRAPGWVHLLVTPDGKIIKKNKRLVVDIICYQAGELLDDGQKSTLLEKYRRLFEGDDPRELPPLVS